MEGYEFIVSPDGRSVSYIYSDDTAWMFDDMERTTRRASHVEPSLVGGWVADLGPVGGPVLGPFSLRRSALDAELEWLRANALGLQGEGLICGHPDD